MAYASWSVVFGEQPSATKWNILGTNDAYFNDFLNGTTGNAWTSWTPSWTNLTAGNGTVSAYYTQIGKTVHFRVKFVLGSTSSVGTNVLISLPVTASSNHVENDQMGVVRFDDSGSGGYAGYIEMDSSLTSAQLLEFAVAGTRIVVSSITATQPFTWATGDAIYIFATYEAA